MTGQQLAEELENIGFLVAPGVYDGVSAAFAHAAGFESAYMSGAAVSASAVGLPDIGLATMSEMVAQVTVIKRRFPRHLIADADTGFGDVTNVFRTVQEYERAGVAAIQIEDQVFPKRCGHLDQKEVVDRAEMVDKVSCAAEARSVSGPLLIARTDARASFGLQEAIDRVNAYADAGADWIFLEAPLTLDEIRTIPHEVAAPIVFNLVPGGKSPSVALPDLREMGYRVVITPGTSLASASAAMRSALERLRAGDASTDGQNSPAELFAALGMSDWDEIRTTYKGVDTNA